MRQLYARIVLWLIEPALELRESKRSVTVSTLTSKEIAAAFADPNSQISKSLARTFKTERVR
ncbi:hypothetical protein ACEN9J_02930 [Variovorax sp. Varisp41]|uniref:hypothetical protein n=1 Tax=Variovorax sp. Varisp41 TaxID=3243033 RepID=UPI0039B59855